jgi:hypothetical protein
MMTKAKKIERYSTASKLGWQRRKKRLSLPASWPQPGDGWVILPEKRLLDIAELAGKIRELVPNYIWFQIVEPGSRQNCPTCNGIGWLPTRDGP